MCKTQYENMIYINILSALLALKITYLIKNATKTYLELTELVDNRLISKELNVFVKIECFWRCASPVGFLLVFRLVRVDSLQDTQSSETNNHH